MKNRLPILTYHSIDDSGSAISTTPMQFRRQMESLRAGGWRTLKLKDVLAGHARGDWPARSVMLTFDDGCKNFVDRALPVLAKCGFTATVFLVAGWVGRANDWPGQPRWAPRLPLADWDDVRAIAAAGMEIGAHSLSHPHLTRLSPADSEREISGCKHVIECRADCAVRSFAYPYGDRSRALQGMVAENYQAGFSTRLAFTTAASPLTALDRIDTYYLRDERWFNALESSGLSAYLRARRWLAALRALTVSAPVTRGSRTQHVGSAQ